MLRVEAWWWDFEAEVLRGLLSMRALLAGILFEREVFRCAAVSVSVYDGDRSVEVADHLSR